MALFTLRRVGLLVPQALGIATLIFVLFRLVPGDPALIVAGPNSTQAQVAEIRRELGLDRPLYVQYGHFLDNLAHGDMGTSLSLRLPVTGVVLGRLSATLALMVASLLVTIVLAVPSGVIAAIRPHGPIAQALTGASILLMSIPNFLLGMILIEYLAVRTRLLPPAGTSGLSYLIMPTLAIAARLIALVSRTTRASVVETLGEDYVRTARAKGLPARAVFYRHALKPAMVPIITMIGLQAGYLLGGSVVVETLFAYQGLGQAMITAVSLRDYFLVQGITVVYVVGFLLINLLVDLSYAVFDPRVRYT